LIFDILETMTKKNEKDEKGGRREKICHCYYSLALSANLERGHVIADQPIYNHFGRLVAILELWVLNVGLVPSSFWSVIYA